MTKELLEQTRRRREFVDLSLVLTTIGLVVSLVIAFTAVSIGIARADTFVAIAETGDAQFAFGVFVVLIAVAAVSGLTALAQDREFPRRDY
jgi:hypothetical protein